MVNLERIINVGKDVGRIIGNGVKYSAGVAGLVTLGVSQALGAGTYETGPLTFEKVQEHYISQGGFKYKSREGETLRGISEKNFDINSPEFIRRFNKLPTNIGYDSPLPSGTVLYLIPQNNVRDAKEDLNSIPPTDSQKKAVAQAVKGTKSGYEKDEKYITVVLDPPKPKNPNIGVRADLEKQAIRNTVDYTYSGHELPKSNPHWESLYKKKLAKSEPEKTKSEYIPNSENETSTISPLTVNPSNVGLLEKIIEQADAGEKLEAYKVPRNTILGYELEGQLRARIVKFYNGDRIKLNELLGENYENLPEILENFNVYRVEKGVYFDFKFDRNNQTVVGGFPLTTPEKIKKALESTLSDSDMRISSSYFGVVKRGDDNWGLTIGGIDVATSKSKTDFVKEGEYEETTIEFKKNPKKINGGSTDGTGGGGNGNNGHGNGAEGNGGTASLEPKEFILSPEMFSEGTNLAMQAGKFADFLALNEVRGGLRK